MAQKKKTTVAVVSQKQIAAQIYDLWVETELAKEAAQDGDNPAFEAISRRAANKSNFLDGMKAAVAALNIEENEFMKAVNLDRLAQGDGREGGKCREQ
jgi:hypothetical protein